MKSTTFLRTLPLALLLGAVPALAEWHFAIPPGWTDLSPGKPVPKEIPAPVAAMIQGGHYHTYAMDLRDPRADFKENLNVIVAPGPMVANQQVLDELLPQFPAQAAREIPGSRSQVVESGIVTVGGQPALRIVVDVQAHQIEMRTLKYVLPGGKEAAIVSYASSTQDFPKFLPAFEAAIQQTQGIAAPPMMARLGARLRAWGGDSMSAEDWQKILGAIGKFAGILVALILYRIFAKRKKKQMPAA